MGEKPEHEGGSGRLGRRGKHGETPVVQAGSSDTLSTHPVKCKHSSESGCVAIRYGRVVVVHFCCIVSRFTSL